TDLHEGRKRLRYWTALALLRGVMSSPAAGVEMIKNRIKKGAFEAEPEEDLDSDANPVLDDDYDSARDFAPTSIISKTDWTDSENNKLNHLAAQLEDLHGIKHDLKAAQTFEIITKWLKEGYNPLVFCRFIKTANYLGEILKESLKKINVQVVTSEDPDEIRKSRIDEMLSSPRKVLIATDCLSEGINLQDQLQRFCIMTCRGTQTAWNSVKAGSTATDSRRKRSRPIFCMAPTIP
ncbi:hypothetical protein LCGC14_3033000, partial [marine sediment metagenome]